MTSSILFMVRAKKVLASNRLNCRFSYSCSYIFDVSCLFPLLSLGRFLRKKHVLVRSSAISKLFLNRRFTFLKYILQNYYSNFKAVFFSPTHKYTNSAFSSQIPFFPLLQTFFRIFFPIKATQPQDLFLILRNTSFDNRFCIWIVISLMSTIRQHRYNRCSGYFCYKTIASQNVSSEAQVENFFVFQKSYVPFSVNSNFGF